VLQDAESGAPTDTGDEAAPAGTGSSSMPQRVTAETVRRFAALGSMSEKRDFLLERLELRALMVEDVKVSQRTQKDNSKFSRGEHWQSGWDTKIDVLVGGMDKARLQWDVRSLGRGGGFFTFHLG
jgi:hypothetical protein